MFKLSKIINEVTDETSNEVTTVKTNNINIFTKISMQELDLLIEFLEDGNETNYKPLTDLTLKLKAVRDAV